MNKQVDLHTTVDSWADIVQKKWRANLNAMNIGVTGSLYDSFSNDVESKGGTPSVIHFKFNHYGLFVDAGVGRGFSAGNKGNLGFNPKRKRKRWYGPIIYAETKKLTKILANKYSINCAGTIAHKISNVTD